jgi:hypothetical protein
MQGFIFEGDTMYPTIVLNKKDNVFCIRGNSTPDNGKEFFEPILNWISEYNKQPNTATEFVFELDFFNISSSKAILFILYKLLELKQAGNDVKITWCYNDAYILGAGRDYAYMLKLPFEFKKTIKKEKVEKDVAA